MRQMHWSWSDLQATPAYVRRFSWDFLVARTAAQQQSAGRHARR